MSATVPFVDLVSQQQEVSVEVEASLADIFEHAAFVGGAAVTEFEVAYANFLDAPHCIGVANGTDAIELALRASGVQPGGEVILPANTFIATAEAVIRAGAQPVLVDVEEDSLLIDPAKVAQAVSPRTQAVIPVHLFGQCARVEEIQAMVDGSGAVVIEDAAQSQGALRHGRASGTIGLAGATSFYPGKNLGAAGDAGAVTTGDDALAKRLRLLANHGSEQKYLHEVIGFNSRLDALQAVVLSAKLARLEKWNEMRRQAAARYDELLGALPHVRLPSVLPGNRHVWHLYVVRVPKRDVVMNYLQDHGIGVGVHYPQAVHQTNAFHHLASARTDLKVSERAAGEILSLPMFPHLQPEQQEKVAEVLGAALRRL